MNPRYAFFTLLVFILLLTGCQSGTDTAQAELSPPTITVEAAIPISEATTPAPSATATVETMATATETEAAETTVVATPEPTTPSPTVTAPAQPTVAPAMPVSLSIPKIEVSASIESVGNDTSGRMDVPQEVDNAAWWNLGPLPGAGGNAVISGHLDTYLQEPAVFWRLRELLPGDTITVRDARGVDRVFEVVNSEVYEHDQVPLDIIFGDAVRIRPNLILITCEGVWDTDARNYDQRFVVYAKMVES